MTWFGCLGSYTKCTWYNGHPAWGSSFAACNWYLGSICSGWRMCFWTSYYGEGSWESSFQLLVWAWFKGAYLLCLEAILFCSGISCYVPKWLVLKVVRSLAIKKKYLIFSNHWLSWLLFWLLKCCENAGWYSSKVANRTFYYDNWQWKVMEVH